MTRSHVMLSVAMMLMLTTRSEAAKCDDNIINMIREKFWNNGHCIPRELIRAGAYTSPGISLRTTKDFYPNEANITCVYSVYEGSVVKVYVQYVNSTIEEAKTPKKVVNNVEKDGVLINEENGEYRYYLYTYKLGVRPFYRCTITGESGEPEGLIKVTHRRYDEEALAQAIQDLASLGIKISDRIFGSNCLP